MKTGAITAVLLVCASIALAGQLDEAKFSDTAETTAKEQKERIRAAARALTNHPWAGEYYSGDGLGVNVSLFLAPGAGYVFEWHGCMGLYDRNYGDIAETNGRIRLSFTFKNERKGFQGIAEEFTPVPWGDRQYLIPSDDVMEFCNRVNGGTEPRDGVHGRHLLRWGDEKKAVSGFPVVPEECRAYLLTEPIIAEIVGVASVTTRPSVCEWKFKDTTVVLNIGTDQGLHKGMELQVVKPAHLVESVRITKVLASTSEGVMTQSGEENEEPEKGWQLSTRCPWAKERKDTTTRPTSP